MFVHTVIMVIEPHMKQGRQHKLISTIFLATSVTKKLDHNRDISNADSTDLRHRVAEPAGQETRQLDFRIFNDFQHSFCRNKAFNFLRYLRQPYIIVIVRIKIVYNTSYVAVSVSNSLGRNRCFRFG